MESKNPQKSQLKWQLGCLFLTFFGMQTACIHDQETGPSDEDNANKLLASGHFVGIDLPSPTLDESQNWQQVAVDQGATNPRAVPKSSSGPGDKRPPILAVRLSDHTAFGVPIGLFADQLLLMRNDGAIQRIRNTDIVQQLILKDRFHSISRSEMAQQLQAEFGKRYIVKQEPPYLIVAQQEHIEVWSKRFRGLLHSYTRYCATHKLPICEIEFPLVAIVFGSRKEFLRYTHAQSVKVPDFCVGYYFSDSNRILLYESSDTSTKETQATISHEATHQLAFNTGLHQRRASTPLWLVEGLATMFESPKLSGLQSHEGKSLWPDSRRQSWLTIAKRPELIQRVIAGLIHNDLAFESDFENAYAVSWAMTAYLSQRRSMQFAPYLNRVGNLPPFEEYEAAERVADFQNAFGTDARLLTNKIISFLEALE